MLWNQPQSIEFESTLGIPLEIFPELTISVLVVAQSAFPKGEVSLGSSDAYSVCEESVESAPVEYGLQLRTPQRVFHLGAETSAERAEWIAALRRVLNTPCTAHDRESVI